MRLKKKGSRKSMKIHIPSEEISIELNTTSCEASNLTLEEKFAATTESALDVSIDFSTNEPDSAVILAPEPCVSMYPVAVVRMNITSVAAVSDVSLSKTLELVKDRAPLTVV